MATVHFGRLQGAAGFARSVAVKRLHPQFAKDPDFVAMFVDEARLAARIAHPNVVPTLDVISEDGELLLVMEYVHGAALSRLVRLLADRGERVPAPIAAAILSGVLHGLHAAHEARSETGAPLDIVHRDVSPQNVLVGADGVARLLDFGVAKAAGRWQSTREGQLKGKTAYMAPEQISGGVVSRKTDVYAASVVLWETLTGKRLFRSDNEGNLLKLVLHGEVSPPSATAPGIPPHFDAVVLRGLDRDPDRRFATAREMAVAVEGLGPVAPPSEIGAWVERVAAEELRKRALRLEEIERGTPPSGMAVGVAAATGEPVRVEVRPPRRALPASGPGPGDSTSQGSHLAMIHAEGAPRRKARAARRSSLGIAVSLALLLSAGVVYLVVPSSREAADAHTIATGSGSAGAGIGATATQSAASSGASPPALIGAPTPGAAEPNALPRPASAASASPGAFAPPAAPPSLAVPPSPAAPAGGTRSRRAAPVSAPLPAARPPPAAAPASGGRPDCSPPYTADEKGHLHFKPACL
ncbi:MAG: serine/threonine protein kinase [Myxococcales bacterium]|nr:serine/threonine protein kinase [Myxococcales bacterium]